MTSKPIFTCILFFFAIVCQAQMKSFSDSLPEFSGKRLAMKDSLLSFGERVPIKIDKISASPIYRMTYAGVPLILTGLIVKKRDTDIRTLRDGSVSHFTKHYDDYTQYLPAAIMLGMKFGGVKGRSSWNRMLVSDLFSAAIMGSVVNTMKTSISVTRPDGSNNHSFPSGHTATAFMCATMLHKEYGLTRSPWYSVGAYSIATATL